jgi:hypothetical protein
MTFKVLDASGNTTFIQALSINAGTVLTQSVPTNASGTAMVGQTTMAGSLPVVIASDQSNFTAVLSGSLPAGTNAIGTVSITQALPAGTNALGTVSVLQVATWLTNITQVGGTPVALGQANMTASIPVVIASNQSAIPVSGTFTATFGGTTNVNLVQIGGTALTIGQGVMTASIPVVIASNQSNVTTVLGAALPAGTNAIGTVSVTGALPAGTNALGTVSVTGTPLFNLVQVGGTTITLGSKVSATSIPVVIASDQTAIPVSGSFTATFGGTTNVNLIQVGGTTFSLGAKVSATSISVVLASDQATVSVSGSLTASFQAATSASVVATSSAVAPVAVKAASGTLYGVSLYCNNTTNPVFLRLYNLATGSINGTSVPNVIIGVPPGDCREMVLPTGGVTFNTAISYQITQLGAANDTTAVNANDLLGWITYF